MPITKELVFTPLTVTGGTEQGFELTVLPRGSIARLRVTQLSGALAGFDYALYNTKIACPPGAAPTTTAVAAGVDPRAYQITPTVTVASSAAQAPDSSIFGLSLPYACMDDADGSGPSGSAQYSKATSHDRKIYLRLNVAGTLAKPFAVAIAIQDALH